MNDLLKSERGYALIELLVGAILLLVFIVIALRIAG